MNEKFNNRYRIPSARAQWHQYQSGSYFVTICTAHREHFFGKVVPENGDFKMLYTDIGACAEQCWRDIPKHFPHVEIPVWVIMPNHVHGIVIINPINCTGMGGVGTQYGDGMGGVGTQYGDGMGGVGTQYGDGMGDVGTQYGDGMGGIGTQYGDGMGDVVETQNFASLQPPRQQPPPPPQRQQQQPSPRQQQQPSPPRAGNIFAPQSKNLASVIRGFKIGVTKFARQNGIPFGWQMRYHDRIIRNQGEMERIANYIENNIRNWGLKKI